MTTQEKGQVQPNDALKAMMRGRRGATAKYEEVNDSTVRTFLNEWANLYATDKHGATKFVLWAKAEQQRRAAKREGQDT